MREPRGADVTVHLALLLQQLRLGEKSVCEYVCLCVREDGGVKRSGCAFVHVRCACFVCVNLCYNGVCESVCKL